MKTIRKNIAEMNGIEYNPEPCEHDGHCPGFCPRCDAEASWLMRELKRKEAAGSPIRIDTISIEEFENLAGESTDEDNDDEILMGCPVPPVVGEVGDPDGDEA